MPGALSTLDMLLGGFPIMGGFRDVGPGAGTILSHGRRYAGGGEVESLLKNPAFRNWFGNSRVVDAQGNPMRVYHTSVADIDRFKRQGAIGFHFGTAGQAEDRFNLKLERDPYGPHLRGVSHNTIPAYLRINNPLRVEDAGAFNADNMEYQLRDLFPHFHGDISRLRSPADIRNFLQDRAYDGLVYKNTGETGGASEYRRKLDEAHEALMASQRERGKPLNTFDLEDQQTPEHAAHDLAYNNYLNYRNQNAEDSWVAFDPRQIKSPFNRGTFDPKDPRFNYASGGEVLDLATRRMRATPENFRSMFSSAMGDPETKKLHSQIRELLRRQGVPQDFSLNRGVPPTEGGKIFDYSSLGEYPHSYLERFDLPLPSRGVPGSLKPALVQKAPLAFMDAAKRGAEAGGWSWYDMSPIHKFVEEHVPEEEREWPQQFMRITSPMSIQTAVPHEMRDASYVNVNYLLRNQHTMPSPQELIDNFSGSSMVAPSLRLRVAGDAVDRGSLRTGDLESRQIKGRLKTASYEQNKLGNLYLPTMDTHTLAGLNLSGNIPPPTKGGSAAIVQELASRAHELPAPYQAAAWTGKVLGAGGNADPYALLLDKVVQHDADIVGKDPTQHMIDVLTGRDYIQNVPKGAVNSNLKAKEGYAGGGRIPKETMSALAQYVRYRLPYEHGKAGVKPISFMDDWGGGTGRMTFAVGDNKLAKLAARPRGLRENELEGAESLITPGLHWRSPDNELALVERMPHTPYSTEMAASFMSPLEAQYLRVKNPNNFSTVHRTDPELSRMMDDADLGPFKKYDIVAGDFFRKPRQHWDLRKPESLQGPVLLDPGALDARILNPTYEKNQYMAPFMDVAQNRVATMTPGAGTSIEDFIMHAPQDQQQSLGFGRNIDDLLKSARDGVQEKAAGGPVDLAGGGVVRNWLRGVPGSGFDQAMGALKRKYRETAGGFAANQEQNTKNAAMQKWIDTNLSNYIVRQMGTEADPMYKVPPRELPEGWLTHSMNQSVINVIPAAEVPGKLWPGSTKILEDHKSGKEVLSEDALTHLKGQMAPPWLQSLIDQDTGRAAAGYGAAGQKPLFLHDLDQQGFQTHLQPHLSDALDYLSQHYTPEQLPQVSVVDALRGSHAWHQALAKKKAEMMEDPFLGTSVHKEYPTGFKWVKFDPSIIPKAKLFGDKDAVLKSHSDSSAAEDALRAGLEQEGSQMGHCVGSYCDDVISGNSHIYSLRDPQGRPHVTVEVNPNQQRYHDAEYQQWYMRASPEERARELANAQADPAWNKNWSNDANMYESYVRKQGLEPMFGNNINQIRGKGNKKPADEYLPYVQDFVRSGKWGDVNELENAGLVRAADDNPKHIRDYLYQSQPENASGLFTQEEIDNAWKQVGGYAEGGQVKHKRHGILDPQPEFENEDARKLYDETMATLQGILSPDDEEEATA